MYEEWPELDKDELNILIQRYVNDKTSKIDGAAVQQKWALFKNLVKSQHYSTDSLSDCFSMQSALKSQLQVEVSTGYGLSSSL